MDGFMRMWLNVDDDSSGELHAEFQAHGFAGHGSAWFDLLQLAAQAKKFGQYPFLQGDNPTIAGGYWKKDLRKKLAQEHLHISAFPINSRGGLGVLIRVAMPLDDPNRSGLLGSAAIELSSNYEQMLRFSHDLENLARGNSTELMFSEQS